MIPKADGDSYPFRSAPPLRRCLLSTGWLKGFPSASWTSCGSGLRGGCQSVSLHCLGNGLSSVEAWFSAALDIEEVLSGVGR